MAQKRRPISEAPKNGEPFIAWEYSDDCPVVACWSNISETFKVPARERFSDLAVKYATWIPLPKSVEV
jgi:hypothetical protein